MCEPSRVGVSRTDVYCRKKAGMKEIGFLQQLAQADPEDRKHMIRLERFFEHKGHLCMVFENLR